MRVGRPWGKVWVSCWASEMKLALVSQNNVEKPSILFLYQSLGYLLMLLNGSVFRKRLLLVVQMAHSLFTSAVERLSCNMSARV